MIIKTTAIAVYILKLIDFGYQGREVLYNQISALVLFLISIAVMIKTHVKLVKERDEMLKQKYDIIYYRTYSNCCNDFYNTSCGKCCTFGTTISLKLK